MSGRPPQPLRQTSTTSFYFDSSNSLRNLGTHPAPADATVSERAQSSMGEHLIEAFFPFFLVYFAVFVCSFLSYLGVLVWSSQKFDWGRDLPSECAGSYSTWWFIFLPLVIFNFTGGEFIKYKLGHRRGEPILPAVKKFIALQGLVGVFLFISGLIMAQSTSALECKAASPSHYTSWLVTLSLGIVVNVMLWGGLGVFTWMSRVMARNGMLTNGKAHEREARGARWHGVGSGDSISCRGCRRRVQHLLGGVRGGGGGGEKDAVRALVPRSVLEQLVQVREDVPELQGGCRASEGGWMGGLEAG